jgi:hypothetical protein
VSSVLLSKDLLEYTDATTLVDLKDAPTKRKVGKCFAVIIQSLSPVVTSSLLTNCRHPLKLLPATLWTYLKMTYSVQVGARQATLVQELLRTVIPEGVQKGRIQCQSAHAQLYSGGEQLSDKMLAYAVTIALPESWSTQKQSLWLQEPLKSESVASADRAEWQRRILEAGSVGTALATRLQQGRRPQQFSKGKKDFPRDENAFCDYHGIGDLQLSNWRHASVPRPTESRTRVPRQGLLNGDCPHRAGRRY